MPGLLRAGKAGEKLDERNQLWLRYAETIRKSEPKYFAPENVPQS